jgi:hypothetical protein
MIVKRIWEVQRKGFGLLPSSEAYRSTAIFEGWFLFGFIPLYIKQREVWMR